jgi:hypothetical protein
MKTATLGCLAVFALLQADPRFHWKWRDAQELGWKQSIRASKLRSAKREALIEAISRQRRIKNVLDTRIEEIDLNVDGTAEVVAQVTDEELCGATGNCPLWVFRWSHQQYILLLEGEAQTFTVQSSKTKGFRDLVLGLHMSASRSELTEYKFDGAAYRKSGCYEANWTFLDENGNLHELKAPRVTPCEKK